MLYSIQGTAGAMATKKKR